MNYKVNLQDNSHYVMGLKDGYSSYNDQMLIYRYDGGDIDTRMTNQEMMLGALYDLYQCNDNLKDGDTFETEFGMYQCFGVHVVKV